MPVDTHPPRACNDDGRPVFIIVGILKTHETCSEWSANNSNSTVLFIKIMCTIVYAGNVGILDELRRTLPSVLLVSLFRFAF
jgi:hypothetical protein